MIKDPNGWAYFAMVYHPQCSWSVKFKEDFEKLGSQVDGDGKNLYKKVSLIGINDS